MNKAPETISLNTRFTKTQVRLIWASYSNGRTALECLDIETGEPVLRATVNLPDEPLEVGETFIKSYQENEGLLDCLVQAGIVEPTGDLRQAGFVDVHVCRWMVEPPTA